VVSRRLFPIVVSFVLLCSPAAVRAAEDPPPPADEVGVLRQELAALRQDYERRLADLEARLAALGTPAPAPSAPPEPGVPASPPEPVVAAAAPASSKVFNPDIAVIGDFLGAAGRNRAPGAPPPLEMHEAEASFQAIVDPYARADFFLAFSPEGAEVEEGFLTFPTLPGGLLMKVGKMRGGFGKVNQMHNHVLPWADRPLVAQNLLGGEEGISDSGISISRLIQNPVVFLEATAEVYRGDDAVFDAARRRDLSYVGRLRAFRDLTESTNLDLGGSFASGGNDNGPGYRTRLIGADLAFRYRPLRRAIYRRLIARSEMVWSRHDGPQGAADAFGTYVSGEYQFARRWFGGARYDYSERATAPDLADKGGSLVLTWWPSEFSQVRGQLRRNRLAEGETSTELLFQFLFSIGAHGAHTF
jgi:hypothetical protein